MWVLIILIFIKHRFFWRSRYLNSEIREEILFMSHRGLTKSYPENTQSSFLDAIEHGYKAIELDVVLSKDNELVCSHNFDLDTETGKLVEVEKEQKQIRDMVRLREQGMKFREIQDEMFRVHKLKLGLSTLHKLIKRNATQEEGVSQVA